MRPLRRNILSLLFLGLCIAHSSFAINENQDSLSYDAHFLTVQEYSECLTAMASIADPHRLYDPERMSGEIIRKISPKNQKPHFFYNIANGVDPQSPMQGLGALDAIRCCNFMETSLPSHHPMTPSTEIGSYILNEDDSFEINDQAQLHLLAHDDGTFEILSKATKEKSSPLMMAKSKKMSAERKMPPPFPEVREKTANNSSPSAINLTLPALVPIIHNDNFDNNSLIGYIPTPGTSDGIYVAIKNYSCCVPDFIKACLMPQETRQQIQAARQEVKHALHQAMLDSLNPKEKAVDDLCRKLFPTRKPNEKKISQNLQKFEQFFTDYNFTRGKLEQFCNQHGITVSLPITDRIPKVSENGRSVSVYGSVGKLKSQAVADSAQEAEKVNQQLTQEDLEYEITETTPLAASLTRGKPKQKEQPAAGVDGESSSPQAFRNTDEEFEIMNILITKARAEALAGEFNRYRW